MRRQKVPTDTERLDWLARMDGHGLISDDAGRWAVSTCGTQNIPDDGGETPFDFSGTFWVEKELWRESIRDAIDAAMSQQNDDRTDASPNAAVD
jgi:hypothetical protein